MSEERDQVAAEEPVVAAEVETVADEASAQGDDQPQLDENGEPIEAEPVDDSEEIEHEGAKYKVPKALKDSFLRQADYTRKTQEIATERTALATERQSLSQQAEARSEVFEQRVQLAQLDAALEQYAALDWSAYADQHGDRAAITAQAQWRQLENAKAGLQKDITDKEAEFVRTSEQATANVLREASEVLGREVEGYGEQLVADVMKTATTYGFTPQELRDSFVGGDGKADVRTFKMVARLAQAEAKLATLEAKQTKAQTAQKVAAVQPAATVKPTGGQYKVGLSDDLPMDEWMRRRNAQLAKAGGR